jgi:erythromycin esterase-like protein
MGQSGEINVGQLMRERHGDDVRNIGFTTYTGTVTAASDWDGPAERKTVRPALPGSYEELFHRTGVPNFWLKPGRELTEARLERAIGVIYLPQSERTSHYFHASLARQFDAVIHYDTTRAVEPLERWPIEHTAEAVETYPSAV